MADNLMLAVDAEDLDGLAAQLRSEIDALVWLHKLSLGCPTDDAPEDVRAHASALVHLLGEHFDSSRAAPPRPTLRDLVNWLPRRGNAVLEARQSPHRWMIDETGPALSQTVSVSPKAGEAQ